MTKKMGLIKIITFILIFIGLAIVVSVSANSYTKNSFTMNVYATFILSQFILLLGSLLLFFAFSVYWDKTAVSETLLFTPKNKSLMLIKGLLFGAVLIGTVFMTNRLLGSILVSSQNVSMGEVYLTIATFVIANFFTAFLEEVIFRGYILNQLARIFGNHFSCFLVAGAFGLIHLLSGIKSPQIVISTFIAGLFLNYAFLQSKNIYFVIGIHWGWNALTGILFSKKLFGLVITNSFLAGIHSPEEGLVAMVVTLVGLLGVLFLRPLMGVIKTRSSSSSRPAN